MAGRVAEKIALVTGAARGMGRSHAVKLAAEGADVIVVDICAQVATVQYPLASPEDLDETVRLVAETGRRAIGVQADVRDLEQLRSGVDGAVAELGGLDIVVANAGICVAAPWDRITPEIMRDTIDTNLIGAWNTVMAGAGHLVRRGGGSIVLISSAAGLKLQPFMVPYMASKFGVTGMAKAFAAELAKDGIRVNSVHPTGVDTPMGSGGGLMTAINAGIEANPRLGVAFTNMLPVEQIEAADVSNAVLFLASEESRQITALAMAVDAGVTQM
jgi:SDR family mycofactocin-dependent oxidoreductase